MKTNGTRILVIVVLAQLLILIFSFSSKSQPDYDFTNGSLVSGTANQVGAKYLYTNVRPGVDAFITITYISSGITVVDLDAGSGYPEALQPTLDIPAATKGYLEMKFEFVIAGTAIPMVQMEIPSTCIDVDGTSTLHEYDEISMSTGSYVDFNLLGGELAVTFRPGWAVGTNIGTTTYPGRDTAAKEAMFSVINANQSQIMIRVGANNLGSSTQQRLRSVYFKKFSYANSYLAKSPLLSFRGIEINRKTELQWRLENENNLSFVVIEKSHTTSSFKPIGEVWISGKTPSLETFRFTDNEVLEGNVLYRLKMISANGSVQYSNILSFHNRNLAYSKFKIYPSSIQSNAVLNVIAEKTGTAHFELVDYSGRVVHRLQIEVLEGNNNVQLTTINNVMSGSYLAVLKLDNITFTQKIIKQ